MAASQEVFTAQEAADLMAQGYQYVDVRGPDEFVAGHAPGAVNIPLGPTLAAGFKAKFPLGTEKLLVGCQSGKRSTMALEILAGAYPEAINFRGSFGAWAASGMPIEK